MKNIFGKFAYRTTFINMGIGLVSLLFVYGFATGRPIPEKAIIHHAIAYGISAFIALFGTFSAKANTSGYSAWRDSLPVFAFASCTLLAGIQKNWTYILFFISLLVIVLLQIYGSRYGTYDERDDRLDLRF